MWSAIACYRFDAQSRNSRVPYKYPPYHQQWPLEALAAVTEHQPIKTKPHQRVRYHALFVTIPTDFRQHPENHGENDCRKAGPD
jgi:hypothetical protein